MFDILLDHLPEDYNGFLIRPDYRIGIQIALCLQDEDLSENDRVFTAISLLFGRGLPPLETAVERSVILAVKSSLRITAA